MISPPPSSRVVAADAPRKSTAYLLACGLPPARAAALSALVATASAPRDATRSLKDSRSDLSAVLEVIDRWSVELLPGAPGESPEFTARRARARMLLAQVPVRWPDCFLAAPAPDGVRAAVERVTLEAAPGLRQTTMTPQPLDLGPLSDVADETWRTFDKWPVLRGLTMWTLFFLLLGVVFYTVRF